MALYDISERFKILDLEDIEEYLLRRKKEKEKIQKIEEEIENKGICQLCGSKDAWWDADSWGEFVCYDCYKNNKIEIGLNSVPVQSLEYMSKEEWLERIEEEKEKKI